MERVRFLIITVMIVILLTHHCSDSNIAHTLLLLLLFGVRCARPEESENTLSVQRPKPHTTNPWKEEEDKIVGDKKERADHANRKVLAQLQQTGIQPKRWSRQNTTARRGARTSAVFFFKKEESYPMGQCHHRNPDPAGAASPPVT